jgi:hypothetical protein
VNKRSIAWFYLAFGGVLGIHLIAAVTTRMTIELMRNDTPFARAVFAHNLALLPYWRIFAYGTVTPFCIAYLWPLVRYFRQDCPQPAPLVVQQRALSFPTVLGGAGLFAWAASSIVFPIITFFHFGRWSTELMSQQILSPWVNGFLAATTAYLFSDWIARCDVVPQVFPDGRTSRVPGAFTLGVRGRLFVFLAAVAFVPLFTMFGLVRAARVRFDAGREVHELIAQLDVGSTGVFFRVHRARTGNDRVAGAKLHGPARERRFGASPHSGRRSQRRRARRLRRRARPSRRRRQRHGCQLARTRPHSHRVRTCSGAGRARPLAGRRSHAGRRGAHRDGDVLRFARVHVVRRADRSERGRCDAQRVLYDRDAMGARLRRVRRQVHRRRGAGRVWAVRRRRM